MDRKEYVHPPDLVEGEWYCIDTVREAMFKFKSLEEHETYYDVYDYAFVILGGRMIISNNPIIIGKGNGFYARHAIYKARPEDFMLFAVPVKKKMFHEFKEEE